MNKERSVLPFCFTKSKDPSAQGRTDQRKRKRRKTSDKHHSWPQHLPQNRAQSVQSEPVAPNPLHFFIVPPIPGGSTAQVQIYLKAIPVLAERASSPAASGFQGRWKKANACWIRLCGVFAKKDRRLRQSMKGVRFGPNYFFSSSWEEILYARAILMIKSTSRSERSNPSIPFNK